jgi:hypothetical protein
VLRILFVSIWLRRAVSTAVGSVWYLVLRATRGFVDEIYCLPKQRGYHWMDALLQRVG